MSDADAEADSDTSTGREDVWVEKYRPERLDEVVGHEAIIERIQAYVSDNDLANLLFAGPAGTGKCVGADTPVLTTHGVEPIGAVVGDADGLESPPDDRRIVTLSADGFEYVTPEHVYAKQADRTLTVDTRDGVSMHVTPEHKLLTVTNEELAWRPADTLGIGDRIVRPESLPMPAGDAGLPWPQAMDEMETLVTAPDEPSGRPLGAADPDNLHDGAVRIRSRLGDDLAPEITPPARLTPDLGEFLGLLLGGGAVHEEALTFSGPATLRDRFVTLATEQFDVTPTVEHATVRIENRTLVAFLTACFDIVAPADTYGTRLVTAPAPVRTAFLRAAFDAGGTITDDPTLEISGTEATATVLAYLLAGTGVPTQRRTHNDNVVLAITEPSAIARFTASIGVIRETRMTALQTALTDAPVDLDGAPAATTPTPMPDGGTTVASRSSPLDRTDLHVDRIEGISEDDTARRVYDLTVPGTHNYVAGTLPTVMHNTTTALAIAKEIYSEDWQENFLELNASDERGIDVVRGRIKEFARASFGEYDFRIIFLDEADALCVPPGTEVVTGYPSSPEVKKIEDVAEDGEPIPSVDFETNEIQSDKGRLVDSGVADFFKIELEDGREIEASLTHPFFVVGEDGTLVEKELREMSAGDEIADFKDDIGVSRCETCGDWTAGRFCSVPCKNEGHSNSTTGEGNPMYGTEWSDERREKIVQKLSDGRLEGENNPNYGGKCHGVSVWELDEQSIDQFREPLNKMHSGTTWDEWVVDADPETVEENIGRSCAEWWDSLDDDRKAELIEKATENCDSPVCDSTSDNNPMRDPEVAQKVSEALNGHDPTGGNIRHSDELGHLVRSDWEYEVAKALQDAGVEYEYEPAFELSESVFHPDFLINNTIVEVKEVAELWGQTEKIEEFLETYGDEYRFVVVGAEELPHHGHCDRDEFEPAVVSDGGVRTVQTVEVRSIEHSHRGQAYNISMEGTPNFMLANGILTHNTSDAQSALRRTMEQFSGQTRFILSCNYSSRIIDPIQSRCAVFRFSPLADEAVIEQARQVADAEGLTVTDDGFEAIAYVADGDMRRAINALQAAATAEGPIDEAAVYAITSTARPEEVLEMAQYAIDGDFMAARAKLESLLVDRGIAGGDILDQLHRSVWDLDIDEAAAVRLMDRIGETEYRIVEGADERIQLESMLASLALD